MIVRSESLHHDNDMNDRFVCTAHTISTATNSVYRFKIICNYMKHLDLQQNNVNEIVSKRNGPIIEIGRVATLAETFYAYERVR